MSKTSQRRIVGDRDKIVQSIERITHYWLEGQYERIAPYLDDDVIMDLPHLKCRIAGKREVLHALRKSRRLNDVLRYYGRNAKVEAKDDIAIAHHEYSLEYMSGIRRLTRPGLDFFVFEYKEKQWWVVRWSVLRDLF